MSKDDFYFIPNINPYFKLPNTDSEALKASDFLKKFIEEAKEQGRQEIRIEIARNLLSKGVDYINVSEITGLCLSALNQIKKINKL